MNASRELRRIDFNFTQKHGFHDARIFIQGVRIDNIDKTQALAVIGRYLSQPGGSAAKKVFFANVHSIHLTNRDKEFQRCINEADLVLADGAGLKIAGRIIGQRIIENLNGTDFIPIVLARAELEGWSVYLFGAIHNIVGKCQTRLQKDYPRLRIAGYHHGHISNKESSRVVADINAKEPNILLVAMGSPLQEKWIEENAPNLRVGVCFAVGGLFDFLSGEVQRAPLWVRRIGAESIYRFVQNPRSKWRRIVIEPQLFMMRVLAARIASWSTDGSVTKTTKQAGQH